MQERHLHREIYFNEQAYTTINYIFPLIEKFITIGGRLKILEIGCGEGGNLKPFLDRGCEVVGIDIQPEKIQNAELFFKNHKNKNNLKLILGDVYSLKVEDIGEFDIIYVRDVIEHIHNQSKFFQFIKKFIKNEGKLYVGFPPWYNPFGGHQQICKSKVLSKLPYFHLLPGFLYPLTLKLFQEDNKLINDLLEIKSTRISIERFKKIIKDENYKINKEIFYLFNPNYEIKFGLKPRKQIKLIAIVPFIRNFFTTSCYYILSK